MLRRQAEGEAAMSLTASSACGYHHRRSPETEFISLPRAPTLESAVMRILWSAEQEALTVREVQQRLEPQHSVAYTTAMTVLVRLWKKGRLERRKVGRAFAYRAAKSWAEYEAERMVEILRSVDDRSLTLNRFVDSLTAREREQLRDMINGS